MRRSLILLAALLLLACPTVEAERTLVGLDVEPGAVDLPAGRAVQLRAMGRWSDGGRTDFTEEAEWFASDPDVAPVSEGPGSRGLVSGVLEGTSLVTATVEMMAASSEITVLPAELELLVATPVELELPVGGGEQLVATGSLSDGSLADLTTLATWTSSDVAVAEVGGGELPVGFVVAVGPGACDVSGSVDGVLAEVSVTVREAELEGIELEPLEVELPLGVEVQFVATGTWSDGSQVDVTTTAAWSSSDPSHLAFIDLPGQEGVAMATGIGGAIVEVVQGEASAGTVVTVTEAELAWLLIDPPTLELSLGTSWPMAVTGGYTDGGELELAEQVTWSSDDPSVVTSSNDAGEQGVVRAVGVGATTLRARLGELEAFAPVEVGEAQLIGLVLAPQLPAVSLGVDQAFTLTGVYTDGGEVDLTTAAGWEVDPLTVALPSPLAGEEGLVLTVAEGSAEVTGGVPPLEVSTWLTVLPPELVSITVTPTGEVAAVGEILQYEATGSYTDGSLTDLTEVVFWATSAPGFAVADNLLGHQGEVTAVGEGTATVLASLSPASGSTTLTVVPAAMDSLSIEPSEPSLPVGGSLQLTALGLYTDGQELDLTPDVVWSSMEPGTVTTSNDAGMWGVLTGVAAGTATVTASSGDTTASVVVEVVAP